MPDEANNADTSTDEAAVPHATEFAVDPPSAPSAQEDVLPETAPTSTLVAPPAPPDPDPVVMQFSGPPGWSMPYPPIAGRSYKASEIGAFWDLSLVRHLTEDIKVFQILDQRVVDELPTLATHLTDPKPPAPAVVAGKTDEKGA